MIEKEEKGYENLKKLGLFLNPTLKDREDIVKISGNLYSEVVSSKYDFKKEILYINAKTLNKVNLYEKFVKEELFDKLNLNSDDYIDKKIISMISPLLSIRYDGKEEREKISFYYEIFIKNLIYSLNLSVCENSNINKFLKETKKALDKKIESLYKVMNQKNTSLNDYEEVRKTCNVNISKNSYISSLDMLEIKSAFLYAKKIKNIINRLNNMNLYIEDKELFKMFDADKLYLVLAYSVLKYQDDLDEILKLGGIEGHAKASFLINDVLSYVPYITKTFGKDYNPKIKIYNKDKDKVEEYGFLDLKRDLNKKLEIFKFDNIVSINIDELNSNNIKNIKQAEKYIEEKRKLDIEALKASWEFIRNGTVSSNNINNKKACLKEDKKSNLNGDKTKEVLEHRLDTLNNTNYMYKIIGINKFNGYIGFLYKDGTVIFEKFYDDVKKKIPCKNSNATYVMNVYNFAEFSKLTKQEIIEYIKNFNDENIKRLYHSKSWDKKIDILIKQCNSSIDIDVYTKINELMGNGVLSKEYHVD